MENYILFQQRGLQVEADRIKYRLFRMFELLQMYWEIWNELAFQKVK